MLGHLMAQVGEASPITLNSTGGSRIKDLIDIEGARDNQLNGYGLVVGLAGTGDSKIDSTLQSIANSLKNYGVNVPDIQKLKSGNVAAVMITSEIGPFARPGSRIDVTVSSIGDAKSLQGGVLLQVPLQGADRTVYAVAQGAIAVGGFLGGTGAQVGPQCKKTIRLSLRFPMGPSWSVKYHPNSFKTGHSTSCCAKRTILLQREWRKPSTVFFLIRPWLRMRE